MPRDASSGAGSGPTREEKVESNILKLGKKLKNINLTTGTLLFLD